MEARIPPNDLEAEQAVLTSMLFDKEAVSIASEGLKGDDFYRLSHKIIFEIMIEMYNKSIPIDLVTLKSNLDDKGRTEEIGGFQYLIDLSKAFSTSANIKHYIKIVKDKSILRKLIKASSDISSMSFDAQEEIDYIVDQAEKKIFDIAENRDSEDFTHIHEILVTSIEKIEAISQSDSDVTGVSTGFRDLDYKTSGFQPSDLILIAARPSMGKTAFALNIAQQAAIRNKVPTAIFSLEMSKEQLVNRLLSAETMIDSQKLRMGNVEHDDWVKIAESMGPLSEAPLYIDDTPGISIVELRAKLRRLKLEKGVGLIMIDYLQLMSGSGRGSESRQQEISEISRSLKAIAREMNAPVIALSQLSRACEARADHRPMLSDLRESGAIEQDADVCMFLYRDDYYYPDSEKKNIAEVIIAKQRNGPTGTVELTWLGQYTKFADSISQSYI